MEEWAQVFDNFIQSLSRIRIRARPKGSLLKGGDALCRATCSMLKRRCTWEIKRTDNPKGGMKEQRPETPSLILRLAETSEARWSRQTVALTSKVEESWLEAVGATYMSGVYKSAMVRMFRKELTNLWMYGSRQIHCRNAVDVQASWVWQSKNPMYEMPCSVKGTVKLTGS